jgi:hypothetical protein
MSLKVKEQSGSTFRAEGDGILKLNEYGIVASPIRREDQQRGEVPPGVHRQIGSSAVKAVLLFCLAAGQALALPTMIRLGYPNCSSCRISPQGGGLLNLYGRGIDRAQSLEGGEYMPSQARLLQFLNAEGRITQDFRIVMQQQDVSTTEKPGTQLFRSRFMYRNASELGRRDAQLPRDAHARDLGRARRIAHRRQHFRPLRPRPQSRRLLRRSHASQSLLVEQAVSHQSLSLRPGRQ